MNDFPKTLHPMSIGDILDQSIQLFRSNFLKFIAIVILIKGTYMIFGYVFKELIMLGFEGTGEDAAQIATYADYLITLLLRVLELLFITPIVVAAMTMAISERFLNRDIGVTEAYRKILRRFLPLLGTTLLAGILISIVLFTCIFLGFSMMAAGAQPGALMVMIGAILAGVLWIWWVFIPQTVVLEGEGGISAMKRSKYLVKGSFIKAFVLVALVFIAVVLITEIASFSIFKLLSLLGQYGDLLAGGASTGLSNVIPILLEPFRIAAMTLLYYDFRIRKEGFDVEIMAEELESHIDTDHYV